MKIYNAKAFKNFLSECRKDGIFPHSMRYMKDGEVRISVDFPPYSASDAMHVYSLSKSFTSVAVGIAADEGYLSLDEKMSEIFPDKMPAEMNENLKEMRLKDVLSMQSGHPTCALNRMLENRESLKTFFAFDTPHKPGTTFVYSTGGTLVCGAAVTRRTGIPLDEFVYDRIFKKMGIGFPRWDKTDDGLCMGGVGLYIAPDDILKFGKMLLDGGVYEGKRIVSEEYIKAASVPHSVDANNGSEDWVAGYGYQFWMNAKGGYRGDGAYGQLCIMLPATNEVFVMMCECGDMQKEYHTIMRLIDGSREKDEDGIEEIENAVNNFYSTPKTQPIEGKVTYSVGENVWHLHSITMSMQGDDLALDLGCDFGTQRILCGNGRYLHSSCRLMAMSPAIVQLHKYGNPEDFNVFASFVNDGEKMEINLLHSDLPHGEKWIITPDKLTIAPRYGGVMQSTAVLCK